MSWTPQEAAGAIGQGPAGPEASMNRILTACPTTTRPVPMASVLSFLIRDHFGRVANIPNGTPVRRFSREQRRGRVERTIRYVRDNFFAARKFTDLDDLNVQAEAWCRALAADRRCPGQDTVSVREAFAAEAPRLLALPEDRKSTRLNSSHANISYAGFCL